MRIARRLVLVAILAMIAARAHAAPPIVVLNVGDSITQGGQGAGGYSLHLHELLGPTGYSVVNAGRSGGAYTRTNRRDYRRTREYTMAIQTPARIVTIMLGTNDAKVNPANPEQDVWAGAKATYEEDVRELIRTFKGLPTSPTVYVVLPPPASNDNRHSIKGAIVRNEIIPLQIRAAEAEMVNIIDMWHTELEAETGDGSATGPQGNPPTKFFLDGVHPSEAGNAVIARKLAEILKLDGPRVVVGSDRTLKCRLFRQETVGDARKTEVTPVAWQWYRDGQAIAAAEGGDHPTLKAEKPGTYAVAVNLKKGSFDRLIAPSVGIE